MAKPAMVERDVFVFAIWAVLGFAGLGFLLEGFSRDSYLVSLAGIGLVVAAFVAHIVVDAVCGSHFRAGEAVLGIGLFGILALTYIVGWLSGGFSVNDFYSGLTLFAVLVVGFVVYLATRFGLRGAFSRFHFKPPESGNSRP